MKGLYFVAGLCPGLALLLVTVVLKGVSDAPDPPVAMAEPASDALLSEHEAVMTEVAELPWPGDQGEPDTLEPVPIDAQLASHVLATDDENVDLFVISAATEEPSVPGPAAESNSPEPGKSFAESLFGVPGPAVVSNVVEPYSATAPNSPATDEWRSEQHAEYIAQVPAGVADSSCPLCVVEPDPSAGVVPEITEKTYDGHPFEYWKSLLQNELKPERRIEAVQAVHRFGTNGHAEEAAAVMLEVLDGYSAAIWAWVAADSQELVEAIMEGNSDDLNADHMVVGYTVYALYEIGPHVPDLLEAHAQRETSGLGPLVAMEQLVRSAPDRAVPILFKRVDGELLDAESLQAELASIWLENVKHRPEVTSAVISRAAENQDWTYFALTLLKDVSFTPETARFLLETMRRDEHTEAIVDVLCTSRLLAALARGEAIEGVAAEEFHEAGIRAVLLAVLTTERQRYWMPALQALVRIDPQAHETLRQIISHPPTTHVRAEAERVLEELQAAQADHPAPTAD